MKKLLFSFVLFVIFFEVVFAERLVVDNTNILFGDVEDKIYSSDYFLANSFMSGNVPMYIAYFDKNENLLEAFVLKNFGYTTSNVHIGYNCEQSYQTLNSYNGGECSLTNNGIYISNTDFSNIKYWSVYSYGGYCTSNVNCVSLSLYDFCVNYEDKVKNSLICSNLLYKTPSVGHYYGMAMFQEYVPANFELRCEPKEVKKGETSDCKLRIKATEEITEIVVPIENELFDIVNFHEVDSWELIDNKDGTVTIVPELPFKGTGVVLSGIFKFKDDLIDDVDIELNNISYTTVDGIEFEGSAKDSVNIYEEIIEEETEEPKKEEVKNPNTVDKFDVVLLCILVVILILSIIRRMKRELD